MVGQVQVVSILMIVHGALALIMGLLYLVIGPLMGAIFSLDKQRPQGPEADTLVAVLSIYYVVMGLLVLVVSILTIVSGIRCLKFRGRTLAIVALFGNVLPMCTIYCAPTALGVLIYGLIVLFNAEVVSAFKMADQGYSAEEIRNSFR